MTSPVLIKAVALALEKPDDPQVCLTILDAIPDGWAKVDGKWVRITKTGMSAHPLPSGSWGRFHDKNSVHMDGCRPVYVQDYL